MNNRNLWVERELFNYFNYLIGFDQRSDMKKQDISFGEKGWRRGVENAIWPQNQQALAENLRSHLATLVRG